MTERDNTGEVIKDAGNKYRELLGEKTLRRRALRALYRKAVRANIKAKYGPDGLNRAYLIGLLQDSIIGNPLAFPAGEEDWLQVQSAAPGQWSGYDFRRPEIFPEEFKNIDLLDLAIDGRLAAFMIDSVMDNDEDKPTPIELVDVFDIDHLFQLDMASPEQLAVKGLIRQTTYAKAYEAVGRYDMFAHELEARGVLDDTIYQVTPKGNTLVMLMPDFGSPRRRGHKEKDPALVPGLLRPA